MMIRIAERKKDGRLLQILRTNGEKVKVRTLNSSQSEWIKSKDVNTLPKPERGIQLRMAKQVTFDQECGCTAIVEVRNGRIATFNVYGDLAKYLESAVRKGNDDTPHHRRVFLKRHGFVRSRGITHEADKTKQLMKIRKYENSGYKVLA